MMKESNILTIKPPVKRPWTTDKSWWEQDLPKPRVGDRDEMVLTLAQGKSILHIGATDAPLTREKFEKNELLHLKLRNVSKSIVGVDIDQESVDFIREKTGVDDIVVTDIINPDTPLADRDKRLQADFDLIMCCDIIEHLSNPGQLLNAIHPYCSTDTRVLLTTPNALSIKTLIRLFLSGKEVVHPDHTAYFSFSTLGELMRRSGFEPVGYGLYTCPMSNILPILVFGTIYRISPNSADGIILMGKASSQG